MYLNAVVTLSTFFALNFILYRLFLGNLPDTLKQ